MEFHNSVMYSCVVVMFAFAVVRAEENVSLHNDMKYVYPNVQNLNSHDILFKDEAGILTLYAKEKEFEPMRVAELMRAYNSCFADQDVTLPSTKRYPFIVIEGNNRQGRKQVARILAKKMGAQYINNPPPCLAHLIELFPRKTQTRNAFFILSTYAAAFLVKQYLLQGVPVVMNGYYYEQAAHVINRIYRNTAAIPPENSVLYNTPENLLKPDMLIYINYPQEQMLEYQSFSYSYKNTLIYQMFKDIQTQIIDADDLVGRTVGQIYHALHDRIGMQFLFNTPVPYSFPRHAVNGASFQRRFS